MTICDFLLLAIAAGVWFLVMLVSQLVKNMLYITSKLYQKWGPLEGQDDPDY